MQKNWSTQETLRFIDEVEARRVLWDTHRTDYRNRALKAAAVCELAVLFETSDAEVLRKLKNLKTQFCAELRKIKKGLPSGSCGVEKPKWVFYDAMKFMEDSLVSRQSSSVRN